jgi:hypothetical protein
LYAAGETGSRKNRALFLTHSAFACWSGLLFPYLIMLLVVMDKLEPMKLLTKVL